MGYNLITLTLGQITMISYLMICRHYHLWLKPGFYQHFIEALMLSNFTYMLLKWLKLLKLFLNFYA